MKLHVTVGQTFAVPAEAARTLAALVLSNFFLVEKKLFGKLLKEMFHILRNMHSCSELDKKINTTFIAVLSIWSLSQHLVCLAYHKDGKH